MNCTVAVPHGWHVSDRGKDITNPPQAEPNAPGVGETACVGPIRYLRLTPQVPCPSMAHARRGVGAGRTGLSCPHPRYS